MFYFGSSIFPRRQQPQLHHFRRAKSSERRLGPDASAREHDRGIFPIKPARVPDPKTRWGHQGDSPRQADLTAMTVARQLKMRFQFPREGKMVRLVGQQYPRVGLGCRVLKR
jgi:hypothetical protein